MNQPDLYDYGIQNEQSDIRAHVSVVNKAIYVFQTSLGIEAIKRHNPREVFATQPGIEGPTARGWLVKIQWIKDLRQLLYYSWKYWPFFSESMSTSDKGALAVKCVCDCMKIGKFPFWIDASEENRADVQIVGVDIVVSCKKRVQVKCDWHSGPIPGTGNLFLQSAERNPLKRH